VSISLSVLSLYTACMKMLVLLIVVLGLGWLYLNRDAWFEPPRDEEFCAQWHAEFDEDDFNLSYDDRARAVAKGCI
jgi:hypothetical protein